MSDCIIQISRDNSFYGSGLTVGVALDGCDVGTLKNGEELRAVAAPGQHELSFTGIAVWIKPYPLLLPKGSRMLFLPSKSTPRTALTLLAG